MRHLHSVRGSPILLIQKQYCQINKVIDFNINNDYHYSVDSAFIAIITCVTIKRITSYNKNYFYVFRIF